MADALAHLQDPGWESWGKPKGMLWASRVETRPPKLEGKTTPGKKNNGAIFKKIKPAMIRT